MKDLLDKMQERLRVIYQAVAGTVAQHTVEPVVTELQALVERVGAEHKELVDSQVPVGTISPTPEYQYERSAESTIQMEDARVPDEEPVPGSVVDAELSFPDKPLVPEKDAGFSAEPIDNTKVDPDTSFTGEKSFVDELNKPAPAHKKKR